MVKASSPELSAAATVDAPLGSISDSLDTQFHIVRFIEGSQPQISSETTNLLRGRLRAAAGLLFLGFVAFLAYRLFVPQTVRRDVDFSFYLHCGITVILAASFGLLCRKCAIPLRVLRGYELAIFGPPVVYTALGNWQLLNAIVFWTQQPVEAGAQRVVLVSSSLPSWMGIAFIYALFIPNSWRRAALLVGIVCVMPVVLTSYIWATTPEFATAIRNPAGYLFGTVVMMSITFLACTYGTYIINILRHEAFEAKQLGQYRLCRRIGSGGMGEVFLAEHQLMKRPCAIKLIRPSKATDPQALARFEREVRATAKLSHWNTIEIFDYGRTDDGTFYYVMEYLPGLSLAELVEKHGPLSPARAIHLLAQTCEALAEAHATGLIHRDIKPGNIFSAQRGGFFDVAKLLDFGLAKPLSTETDPVHLTQEGSITGSPLFMAPEQALGDSEPDARSDVYSLGAVAYFLLTGTAPFLGEKAIKIILAHAHEPVVPPSRLRHEIPADLEKVVLRCLAKNPADRYQSVLELHQALCDCVAAGGWTHEDAASWWRANGVQDSEAQALAAAEI